jgi:hypothetical protein
MTEVTLPALDLVAVSLLVFGLYVPRHRRRDLVLANSLSSGNVTGLAAPRPEPLANRWHRTLRQYFAPAAAVHLQCGRPHLSRRPHRPQLAHRRLTT